MAEARRLKLGFKGLTIKAVPRVKGPGEIAPGAEKLREEKPGAERLKIEKPTKKRLEETPPEAKRPRAG